MTNIDFSTPTRVHFIGIGGISMSGLAELLISRGFPVSGSDNKLSELTEHLASLGAQISAPQSADNITDDIRLVVYTAAIHPDNPEYAEAVRRNIPMMSRAELLGQIMKLYPMPVAISGTHGKTTTTSMISEILMAAAKDPTISVGGVLPSIGGNFHIGGGDIFVTEACEYTNSFLSFFPRIGIILNIEEDHMDFFHDLAEIRTSFHRFAQLLPGNGALIINGMIPDYQAICENLSCTVITFGNNKEFDYWFSDVEYDDRGCVSYVMHHGEEQCPIQLAVPGIHNVCNSMATLAASGYLGLDTGLAATTLLNFRGADRRFEVKGHLGTITVVDDYAHHPTEIRATLNAAAHYPHHEVWCVFQPHTYSRTKAFLNEFADALTLADHVILTDIYAARETDCLGISSSDIASRLEAAGKDVHYFSYFDDVETFLLQNAGENDLIITMGAGDVYRIGEYLLGR